MGSLLAGLTTPSVLPGHTELLGWCLLLGQRPQGHSLTEGQVRFPAVHGAAETESRT